MRKLCVFLAVAGVASAAQAVPKAIRCDVLVQSEYIVGGKVSGGASTREPRLYVIDDDKQTFREYGLGTGAYFEICSECTLLYGSKQITYSYHDRANGAATDKAFVLDRIAGTYQGRDDFVAPLYAQKMREQGSCKSVPLPSTSEAKAKF